MKTLTWPFFPPQHQTFDKGHGRVEVRSIWTSDEINDYVDFPHVGQVFWVRREVTHLTKNKETIEIAYGITSLTPEKASPQRLLDLNRMHWGIENSLHWVRDETFREDRSQIKTGNAPRVMATLKNLAITILRRCGATNIAKTVRGLSFKMHHALNVIGL